ncbi:MAG: DUF134 domain-containing protein [Selenomonadaceae bacterium]|nr:DUF134 domain-containing protein [Selenomonadaceae bacterium]
MARPQKERKVCPGIQGYCFHGNDGSQPVDIPVDELEALRLCDLEERSQEAAAVEMNISRGTLQRLLYSAHKKIAFALLYGRTIQTEGRLDSKAACLKRDCHFCAETYRKIPKTGENTMKIAVTCENNEVFQHFGHTPSFAVFTVEGGKVVAKEILDCGENGHGALAGLLKEGGVDLLICGGIGGGAQMALAEAGVKLIGGAAGNVDEVVKAYLDGTLMPNPDFQCHHYDGEATHSCGSHGCHEGGAEHKCGNHRH